MCNYYYHIKITVNQKLPVKLMYWARFTLLPETKRGQNIWYKSFKTEYPVTGIANPVRCEIVSTQRQFQFECLEWFSDEYTMSRQSGSKCSRLAELKRLSSKSENAKMHIGENQNEESSTKQNNFMPTHKGCPWTVSRIFISVMHIRKLAEIHEKYTIGD